MPARLEELDCSYNPAVPLVLIHDGGGTIFQYYMLGPLNRTTFAIASPYFDSGIRPTGGVPELAKEYASAIRNEIGRGSVILGGTTGVT